MRITIAAFVVSFVAVAAVMGSPTERPGEVFQEYLKAIADGRYAEAEHFWAESTINASKRLGITFDNIPAKYDCASPVVNLLPDVRAGRVKVSVDTVIQKDGYAEIQVSLESASDSARCRYIAVQSDDGWRLASPLQALTAGWNIRETDFIKLYYADSTRLNNYACAELDQFVEKTGRSLGLTADDFETLRREKILYYVCNENQIKDITGYVTQGMADLPLDAVISTWLPHRHELTHLLVNFAARNISLYTAPFLQEGTAVFFGGRWGRSSKSILYAGSAIIRNDIVDIGDVLTYNDFHTAIGSPDISYPLSAMLVACLQERLAPERFMDLYRELSGSLSEVSALSEDSIKAVLGNYYGGSWDEIVEDCRHLAEDMNSCGIAPMEESPESAPMLIEFDDSTGIQVRIWDIGDEYGFEIAALGSDHEGLLMISNGKNDSPSYVSRLFMQHAPGREYHGEPFGIKFTEQEVGCYDYLCDELTGIYVPGFAGTIESPAPNLWDASARTYRLTIEKALCPSLDPSTWRLRIIAL